MKALLFIVVDFNQRIKDMNEGALAQHIDYENQNPLFEFTLISH